MKDRRQSNAYVRGGMLAPMATGTKLEATVLLVEADPLERDRFGEWLEGAGFEVVACSGPGEPDYTCIGTRGGTCPLASGACVVVLDMSLDGEAVLAGTPAEELLGLYIGAGHNVLVLGSRRGEEVPGELLRLRRHPERERLLGAVRSLFDGPPPGPRPGSGRAFRP